MKKKNHVAQSSLGSEKKPSKRWYYYLVVNTIKETDTSIGWYIRKFYNPLTVDPQVGIFPIENGWTLGTSTWSMDDPTSKLTKKKALTLIRKTYPNFPDHDLPN